MSSVTNSNSLTFRPAEQIIERKIPGSKINVVFSIQKFSRDKFSTQASVYIGDEMIPNVPMEAFPVTSNSNYHQVMKIFQEMAIDYVSGKIIFLQEKPHLLKEWKKLTKTIYCSDEQENPNLAKYVKIIKENRTSKQLVDAYQNLGTAYFNASKYRESLLCYQYMYNVAIKIDDKKGVGMAHCNLGLVYHKLGEIERTLSHHLEELKMGQCLNDEAMKGRAIYNLGNIHESCGLCEKALSYFKKYLEITIRQSDKVGQMKAYASLGHAYACLGEYLEAKRHYETSLKIKENVMAINGLASVYKHEGDINKATEYLNKALDKTTNLSVRGNIIGNLGIAHEELGQYSQAQKYYREDLSIAQRIGNLESEANACFNLGALCLNLNKNEEGKIWLSKAIPIANGLKDHRLRGMIFGARGVYFDHHDLDKSRENHLKHLANAEKLKNPEGQGIALISLGNVYLSAADYELAIMYYNRALIIVKQIDDHAMLASLYYNFGRAYQLLNEHEKAIENFKLAIEIYRDLHTKNCKEKLEWQISLFEKQYKPYRYLEEIFQTMDQKSEALLIADLSRARALVGLLGEKLHVSGQQQLSLDKIQGVAARFQTTIVMYSCHPINDNEVECYVISPENVDYRQLELKQKSRKPPEFEQGNMIFRASKTEDVSLSGEKLQVDIKNWIAGMEMDACRGPESNSNSIGTNQGEFKQLMQGWYGDFIAPIEKLLPQTGERVTIIPDAFLHDLPFALFLDSEGKNLFEKYTLNTIPSIEVLLRVEALDEKNRPHRNFQNACVASHAASNDELGLSELKGVKKEGETVVKLFPQTSSADLTSVKDVKENISQSGNIHLACHGLAYERENEHSVFEGALVMSDRLLYTEDIVGLNLNAELAMLTACHSGKGKVYREGSVGLPFAFLAAGVSSVIATRWKIFDEATHEIVSEFYQHYLGKTYQAKQAKDAGKPFGPAEALREAMLFAKNKYPTKPQAWGAFFLVGLPGRILNQEPVTTENLSLVIWTDADEKYQLQFEFKEGIVKAKHSIKNSLGNFEYVRDFQEREIIITNRLTSGFKKCRLSNLKLEEKK